MHRLTRILTFPSSPSLSTELVNHPRIQSGSNLPRYNRSPTWGESCSQASNGVSPFSSVPGECYSLVIALGARRPGYTTSFTGTCCLGNNTFLFGQSESCGYRVERIPTRLLLLNDNNFFVRLAGPRRNHNAIHHERVPAEPRHSDCSRRHSYPCYETAAPE